jgi:hypothetical protein
VKHAARVAREDHKVLNPFANGGQRERRAKGRMNAGLAGPSVRERALPREWSGQAVGVAAQPSQPLTAS